MSQHAAPVQPKAVVVRKVRVMIVEDQPLFRDLLRAALSGYGHMDVIATADSGRDAIRLAGEHKPDAILMDVDLGEGMTGIEAAQKIKENRPETGVVILSSHRDKEYLQSVAEGRGGGWSYLLKQSLQNTDTLIRAIEGSTWGLISLDPVIIDQLTPRATSALDELTERQMVVLKHVTGGLTTTEIARKTEIPEQDVEQEVERICDELGVGGGSAVDMRARAAMTFLRETSTGRQ